MTITEFENTSFAIGTQVSYEDDYYLISAVDFKECLIQIDNCHDEPFWVRCENCILKEHD